MNETNMQFYNACREVPKNAQRTISAGRLRGMTDINPQWRIQKLTEMFGPEGLGWSVETVRKWIEDGANGEKCAFTDIKLYVKFDGIDGEWSRPIEGTGGSMLVTQEKSGLHTSDEAFKMARTDAISVACKELGMGANVYWAAGKQTKYDTNGRDDTPFPDADNGVKVQPNDIQMIHNIMTVYPKENRDTSLKLMLAKYKADKVEDLSAADFVKFREELLQSADKMKNTRLLSMVKSFAEKGRMSEKNARDIIETGIGKLDDVTVGTFNVFASQFLQMYKDLEIRDEQADD